MALAGLTKKWGRRVVEAAAILAITAALTEIAFRVVHAIHPIYIFPVASYNRFRAQPGTEYFGFPVNSHGFVDVEPEFKKPQGTYRVLGIGDSFVFGVVPYPDNFLTVLEDELKETHPEVEVLNMGVPRADTSDYLLLLRQEGLRLDPDFVIVHFYIGNDFYFNPKHTEEPRSFLGAFLRYVFRIMPQFEAQVHRGKLAYDDDAPTVSVERFIEIEMRRVPLFDVNERRHRKWFPKVSANLAALRDLSRDRGARFLVVILPEELQVSTETRRLVRKADPDDAARRYDWTLPNRALRRELDRLGIPYLDLLPRFRKAGLETRLYKPRDTHWNVRGNRLAAETMRDFLIAGDWLSPAEPR